MISIIIPAHNEKHNLEQRLQELSNNETIYIKEIIIALSPDSKDGLDCFMGREGVKVLRCVKRGRACQMNEGAITAKGEVLAFLHADVAPSGSFLEAIDSTIAGGFDAVFFSYKFDKDNFWLNINSFFTTKDGLFTGGGDQCLFIRKTVFNSLGGFDNKQVLMEDFEFFKRMKKEKVRYKIVKNNLIVSARKFENNSYFRVNLSNLLLVLLFKMGYPSEKLKSLHNKLLRIPYSK